MSTWAPRWRKFWFRTVRVANNLDFNPCTDRSGHIIERKHSDDRVQEGLDPPAFRMFQRGSSWKDLKEIPWRQDA